MYTVLCLSTIIHIVLLRHIDLSVVDALINDMVANQLHFDVLILFWLGEPLLHPQFSSIYRRFVRSIHQHGIFSSIEVHTNSILLDTAKRRVFLNQLPVAQKIHCTIDAFQSTTYKSIKGRDALPTIMENVEMLLREKSQLQSQNPRVVLQYIVGSNNVAEAAAFKEYWCNIANSLQLPFFVSAGQIPNTTEDIFFRQLDCPTEEEQYSEGKVFVEAMQQLNISFPQHEPSLGVETGLQPRSGF